MRTNRGNNSWKVCMIGLEHSDSGLVCHARGIESSQNYRSARTTEIQRKIREIDYR